MKKVALIVADFLADKGVKDVFTVTGGGAMHLNDAFGHSTRLKCTYNHHEQACSIAAEGYAPFEVSDIEVNRPGNTYSFETLEELKANNPDAELFFIVGADTVCAMRTWREPARLVAVCTILAAMREDQVDPEKLREETRSLEKDFGARIYPVSIPNIGISSTQIRERAALGKSIHYLVPDPLESYIIETGIYK